MIVLLARFKSTLPEETVRKIMVERAPEFRAIPGLVQKHYIHDRGTGEFGGLYFWDSEESMAEYRKSDLAATIAKAYETEGTPRVEVMDCVFPLRG